MNDPRTDAAMDAQHRYARILDIGTRIAYVALLASFFSYVLGLVPPGVPLAELPKLWHLSAKGFVAATGSPVGWGWTTRLGEGTSLNLAAVTLLVLVALPCYLAVLPRFARAGDRALAALAAAHAIILVVAAFALG